MSKVAVSIEGYIANELEVRNAGSHRVVEVSVPHTPRKQVDGRWEDAGETEWFKATFWDEHADAVLGAVGKGALVVVAGSLKSSPFTRRDGSLGAGLEITSPVLSVVVPRPRQGQSGPQGARTGDNSGPGYAETGSNVPGPQGGAQSHTSADWATTKPAVDTWGGGSDDLPF